MLNPILGSYQFKLHYFSDHGNGPATAEIKIWLGTDCWPVDGVFTTEYALTVNLSNVEGIDSVTLRLSVTESNESFDVPEADILHDAAAMHST